MLPFALCLMPQPLTRAGRIGAEGLPGLWDKYAPSSTDCNGIAGVFGTPSQPIGVSNPGKPSAFQAFTRGRVGAGSSPSVTVIPSPDGPELRRHRVIFIWAL